MNAGFSRRWRLEHRTEKWNPVFGLLRCSIKWIERPSCVPTLYRMTAEARSAKLIGNTVSRFWPTGEKPSFW